jgi:hypothetical protein
MLKKKKDERQRAAGFKQIFFDLLFFSSDQARDSKHRITPSFNLWY